MGTPVLRMRDSWEGELNPAQKLDSQSRASALYSLAVSKLWDRMPCTGQGGSADSPLAVR